jgi:hypothetical protein
MNTNLIYHVLAPSLQENSLATIYPMVINTDNATGALIRIVKYNQPVDSTLLMRGSLTLSTMRNSGINATIPENLIVDGKQGFLISGTPMADENTTPGFVIFQSQYWLDSKDCECGPVSVGTTSVEITSTYPQDITMNLLNSLHIENTGLASLAANIRLMPRM